MLDVVDGLRTAGSCHFEMKAKVLHSRLAALSSTLKAGALTHLLPAEMTARVVRSARTLQMIVYRPTRMGLHEEASWFGHQAPLTNIVFSPSQRV